MYNVIYLTFLRFKVLSFIMSRGSHIPVMSTLIKKNIDLINLNKGISLTLLLGVVSHEAYIMLYISSIFQIVCRIGLFLIST